jgi:hypothetical protein
MRHKHHKIAASRGGPNQDWNFQELSPYDHALTHALDFVLFESAPQFDFRHPAWPLLPLDLQEAVRKETSQRMSQRVVSEKTRRKLSESLKGRSPANKGKPMSQEQKDKISQSRKGTPPHNKGGKISSEQKRKISQALSGRPLSPERRQKISQSMKGKTPWNKGLKKID